MDENELIPRINVRPTARIRKLAKSINYDKKKYKFEPDKLNGVCFICNEPCFKDICPECYENFPVKR